MDEELKKYGAGIALCAFFVIFSGSTFTIWGLEMEGEIEDEWGDSAKSTFEYTFSIDEGKVETSYDGETYDSDIEYGESDCNCDEVESFFGNLKLLFYGLLISGAAMAYIGHTGEKTEYTEKAIGAAALFSVIIVVYTFMSLPDAFEEDWETLTDDTDMPGFYGTETDKTTEDGYEVKTEVKAKPGLGYIAGVISLGLAGYLIRERRITLEDITG